MVKHISRLVLWDIDGTLVDSAKLGRDAFADAFERVTGAPPRRMVPFAGRTDLEIALDLLEHAGVRADGDVLERFGAELHRAMVEREPELRARGRAYPGARARKRGVALSAADAVLVGDAPLDIAAAREGGARSVGMATGPYTPDQLATAGADVVLEDLRDTDAVLAAVLTR